MLMAMVVVTIIKVVQKREPVIISGDWSSDIVASGLASGFWLHQDDNQKDDNQHDDNQTDDNQLDDNQRDDNQLDDNQ